jgi:hypothetical protein
LLYLKGHVFMSETASVAGQKSQESGIQSVPGTQGTTQAHTAGEWSVDSQSDYGTFWIVGPLGRGQTLAAVLSEPEAAANARLIAAAPKLLRALARAEEHLDILLRTYRLTSGDAEVTAFVRDEAQAAIAKAAF